MSREQPTPAEAREVIQYAAFLARQWVLQGDSIACILVHVRVHALAGEHTPSYQGVVHAEDGKGRSTFDVLGVTEEDASRLGIQGFRPTSAAFMEESREDILRKLGRI
jgi:hypothetical protein